MVQIHSPRPFLKTSNLRTDLYPLTAWCRTRRSMVQIESLRLRYFSFSHRLIAIA